MIPMRIGKTVYKVSDFVAWQRDGSLVLSPSFQRRPVWKKIQKSYLIDTVTKGLPTPVIYIREQAALGQIESTREVVDGQQRLRTLFSFIDRTLLSDFNPASDEFLVSRRHNPAISDKLFEDLSVDTQRKIMNYEFSTHILPSDTDDREVLQIFSRINSTGTRLSSQELRNAEFTGEFKLFIFDLAHEQLSRWREWGIFDESAIARMAEVELASELVMFMHRGVQGKNQRSITKFYSDHEEDYPDQEEVARRFTSVLDAISDRVGADLAASPFSQQALFYTLFTFIYKLQYGESGTLDPTRPRRLPRSLSSCIRSAAEEIEKGELPEDVAKALRGATAHKGTREERLKFLRRICEGATT